MKLKPAQAGALALALMSAPAYAANDVFTVNGASIAATAPGGYLPAVAAYFPNGLFSSSNPGYVQGSLSASLSGFAPAGAYATLSVSTTSGNVALPAGSTIVVYNTGANAAFVKLGASGGAATTGNDMVAPGGALALTVGTNAYLAAITASGTTMLNISGGAGLPTGWGGGSGGGGTVAQGTAAAASGAWPFYLAVGGAAVGPGNALSVQPGAGAAWSLAAGTNTIGSIANTSFAATQSGTWSVGLTGALPGFASTPAVNVAPSATGGWSKGGNSGLTNTVVAIKTSAGQLARLDCGNPNASSAAYVQLFDAATTSVTLGTTTPNEVLMCAAGQHCGYAMAVGDQYSTAISIAATAAASGSTAPSTTLVCAWSYQ